MNWNYLLIGLVRRYVPKKILFEVMKRRGDGSVAEDSPDSYLATWKDQFSRHGWSFQDKHILEIGSGRYARFALQMLAAGACRVTLIDFYAVSLEEPAHREILIKDCRVLGLNCDDAFSRIDVIKGDITRLPSPVCSQRVDLAISHSVLEHVRDPKAVMQFCLQWLKPGGITHHIVDLRDHNLRFRYPFEMLTFSDQLWARWFDLSGGFHLNRWRVPAYLQAVRESGFVDVGYDVLLRDEAALKAVLPRVNCRFRSMEEKTLAILCISLFGHKPFESAT